MESLIANPSLVVEVYPKLLWVLLALWASSLPWALAALRRRLSQAPRGTALLLAALCAAGLGARSASPAGHRVLYDEYETLDASRRLARTGLFAETRAGGLPGWDAYAAPTRPGGHHATLALALRAAGDSPALPFRLGALLGALTALFVFWAALEAGGDSRGALAAAALWAFSPLAASWAPTADLSSSWLFYGAAGLAAAQAARGGPGVALFAAASLALAAQSRPEGALFAVWGLWLAPRAALAALATSAAPLAIAAANRAAGVPGYDQGLARALGDAAAHLGPNLVWLASRPESWLVAVGAAAASRRPRAAGLLALAAAHLLVSSATFRGRFDSGAESRYALGALLPAAVAAGPGLASAAAPAVLLAAGAWALSPAPPRPRGEEAIATVNTMIPPAVVVLAFNAPAARELLRRPVVDARLYLEDPDEVERRRAALGAPPELLLWKDWAWRARAEEASRLESALAARYDAHPQARDGEDELVLLAPKGARSLPR